jgi:hypothetical protein
MNDRYEYNRCWQFIYFLLSMILSILAGQELNCIAAADQRVGAEGTRPLLVKLLHAETQD